MKSSRFRKNWPASTFGFLLGEPVSLGRVLHTDEMTSAALGRLVPITKENWRQAMGVRVTELQEPLVTDHQPVVLVILAKAYVGVGGWDWEPLGFETAAGELVAVVGLAHQGTEAQVFNLAVDHRHQRAGIGTALMTAIIDHLRPSHSKVSLTVHPENLAAQGLYRSCGLAPTGEMKNREPVWALEL